MSEEIPFGNLSREKGIREKSIWVYGHSGKIPFGKKVIREFQFGKKVGYLFFQIFEKVITLNYYK